MVFLFSSWFGVNCLFLFGWVVICDLYFLCFYLLLGWVIVLDIFFILLKIVVVEDFFEFLKRMEKFKREGIGIGIWYSWWLMVYMNFKGICKCCIVNMMNVRKVLLIIFLICLMFFFFMFIFYMIMFNYGLFLEILEVNR